MVGAGEADNELWGSGRGAIAGCYGWGEGKDHFWMSGRGAIAVPLQSADLCFIFSFYVQGHQFHPDTRGNNNEFCFELLADVTLLSTLQKNKNCCLLSGVYAGIILFLWYDLWSWCYGMSM